MFRTFKSLAAASLALLAAPALAQTATVGAASNGGTASVLSPHALSTMQTTRNRNQAPAFHIFGVPVVIQAPVTPPYNADAAYTTFAGQPGQGPNAVIAASQAGTP